MTYYDVQQLQQSPWLNPQTAGMLNSQFAQASGQLMGSPMQGIATGLGQAAYGQPLGQFGYGPQPYIGGFGPTAGWGQQRQLSQQDVGDVVRQLVPILPQILAQAQQPQSAGYAALGPQRQLTPQDVNEVARQLLPIMPQIIGLLQGQSQLPHAAMYGSPFGQFGQAGFGQGQPNHQIGSPFSIAPLLQQQQPFGQPGWPFAQAAFGGQGAPGSWNSPFGQRQLTQQDVTEVTRQLVGLIPQVIGNLQALNQQRMM